MALPALSKGEDAQSYCKRLERLGFDDLFILKTLKIGFDIEGKSALDCFDDLQTAQCRYVQAFATNPKWTRAMRIRKLVRLRGLSEQEAGIWLDRCDAVAPVFVADWAPSSRKNHSGEDQNF